MSIETKVLGPHDGPLFQRVAAGVFDHEVQAEFVAEFLNDPRHHIAVAMDTGTMVGFVSAVHYVHPDKGPELWINEVSVAEEYRRQGIARTLLELILAAGRTHGCEVAWVGTSRSNIAAMQLYRSAGKGRAELEDFVMFTFPLTPGGESKFPDA